MTVVGLSTVALVGPTSGPSRQSSIHVFILRRGNRHLIIALVLALSILVTSWPEEVHDRSYAGELWGDLEAEGFIWGEQRSEHEYVSFWLNDMTVNVMNLSTVWLFDPPDGKSMNRTVECHNRSLTIISRSDDQGRFTGNCWDVDMRCVYSEFNGTFVSDTDIYYPDYRVSWLEGRASVRHDDALEWDIELSGCLVVIDGTVYENATYVRVGRDDIAELEVRGAGSVDYNWALFPHINGTLRMKGFVHVEGDHRDRYQQLVIRGTDIGVRTVDTSSYGTGGPFAFYDPWEVEVTASPDADIEIIEAFKLPLWVEPALIVIIVALAIAILVNFIRTSKRVPLKDIAKL